MALSCLAEVSCWDTLRFVSLFQAFKCALFIRTFRTSRLKLAKNFKNALKRIFNEIPRDWGNWFDNWRVRYIAVLLTYILL